MPVSFTVTLYRKSFLILFTPLSPVRERHWFNLFNKLSVIDIQLPLKNPSRIVLHVLKFAKITVTAILRVW